MNDSAFSIKTSVFEGPLDLLLHLVQKRKLFINDISLASVADEYISHLQTNTQVSLHTRAAFIAIASTLLLIKSKSLLPTLELTVDEEQDIRKLESRLFLYNLIQDAGQNTILSMFLQSPSFPRVPKQSKEIIFSPDTAITTISMHDTILEVLRTIPVPPPKAPQVIIEKVLSLEEMISSLTERIQKSIAISFSTFSDSRHKETEHGKKVHIIVSFLALLELVRQGILEADQSDPYGDIAMQKRNDDYQD